MKEARLGKDERRRATFRGGEADGAGSIRWRKVSLCSHHHRRLTDTKLPSSSVCMEGQMIVRVQISVLHDEHYVTQVKDT